MWKLSIIKYLAVMRISLLSSMRGLSDQMISSAFLVVVLFVTSQLWRTAFSTQAGGRASGFGLKEMIWYMVGTEVIILSLPRVHSVISQEVRSGDIAMKLNKPFRYLPFHYASFLGETILRTIATILTGVITAVCIIGWPEQSLPWTALVVLPMVLLITQALNFCYLALIGLIAFWTEDVMGFYFLLDRSKWLLGGLLIPLEFYPDNMRRVVELLPFRYMIYDPAKLLVKYDFWLALSVLEGQLMWLAFFAAFCWMVYGVGIRRVSVHGG